MGLLGDLEQSHHHSFCVVLTRLDGLRQKQSHQPDGWPLQAPAFVLAEAGSTGATSPSGNILTPSTVYTT